MCDGFGCLPTLDFKCGVGGGQGKSGKISRSEILSNNLKNTEHTKIKLAKIEQIQSSGMR